MPAPMVKTSTPGIYKRGSRYVVVYRANGQQRKEAVRTLKEARDLKAKRTQQVNDGEYQEASRQTLHEYAREWVERYRGRGRHGFREQTRDDYRRMLEAYALAYFPERLRLTEITPLHVSRFIAWLCDAETQGRRVAEEARARRAEERGVPASTLPLGDVEPVELADRTVRNVLGPLRACLATARREGLIRHNPADGAELPHRPTPDADEEEDVRALSREQLAAFLAVVHPRHRLLFRVLAATGLRVSEAIALQWRHVHLDGDRPHVKVRQGLVRGRMGPPKTRHSRRDVPLPRDLVDELRSWHKQTEWPGAQDHLFVALNGSPLHVSNVRRRVLKPAAEEAGAAWAGFHTFRHTFASLHIYRGTNVVQLSRLLGHHSAAFTLSTYVHLIDGDVGEPLDITAELAPTSEGATEVATSAAFGAAPSAPEDALEAAA